MIPPGSKWTPDQYTKVRDLLSAGELTGSEEATARREMAAYEAAQPEAPTYEPEAASGLGGAISAGATKLAEIAANPVGELAKATGAPVPTYEQTEAEHLSDVELDPLMVEGIQQSRRDREARQRALTAEPFYFGEDKGIDALADIARTGEAPYVHHEPSVDLVADFYRQSGDTTKAEEVERGKEGADAYIDFANSQWLDVLKAFKATGYPVIRAEYADPDTAATPQQAMAIAQAKVRASTLPIAEGLQDALTLGIGDIALPAIAGLFPTDQRKTQALAALEKEGVIQSAYERSKDIERSAPWEYAGGMLGSMLGGGGLMMAAARGGGNVASLLPSAKTTVGKLLRAGAIGGGAGGAVGAGLAGSEAIGESLEGQEVSAYEKLTDVGTDMLLGAMFGMTGEALRGAGRGLVNRIRDPASKEGPALGQLELAGGGTRFSVVDPLRKGPGMEAAAARTPKGREAVSQAAVEVTEDIARINRPAKVKAAIDAANQQFYRTDTGKKSIRPRTLVDKWIDIAKGREGALFRKDREFQEIGERAIDLKLVPTETEAAWLAGKIGGRSLTVEEAEELGLGGLIQLAQAKGQSGMHVAVLPKMSRNAQTFDFDTRMLHDLSRWEGTGPKDKAFRQLAVAAMDDRTRAYGPKRAAQYEKFAKLAQKIDAAERAVGTKGDLSSEAAQQSIESAVGGYGKGGRVKKDEAMEWLAGKKGGLRDVAGLRSLLELQGGGSLGADIAAVDSRGAAMSWASRLKFMLDPAWRALSGLPVTPISGVLPQADLAGRLPGAIRSLADESSGQDDTSLEERLRKLELLQERAP